VCPPLEGYAEFGPRLAHGCKIRHVPLKANTDLTALLLAWRRGDAQAGNALMSAVYDDLRHQARAYFRREWAARSLSPTGLVHEAYLRLVDQQRVEWRNRAHFYALAAQAMRRVLVDHARARLAAKRGRGVAFVPLDDLNTPASPAENVDILMLDEALQKLAALAPRQVQLVEIRYFGGLSIEQAAAALGVSTATAKRDWMAARAWLYRELHGDHE
jgi:RNA polymerase sigma-70 factor (ECF subfamily)